MRRALPFLLALAPVAAMAADGIALGARAPSTTLISISGIDTSEARISAVLTQAEYDECNKIGGQTCGTGNIEPNEKFVITADCKAGTVVDIDGKRYRRTGNWAENEDGAAFFEGRPKFVGDDGELAYASNAYNGGRLAIGYERLCPEAATATVVSASAPRGGTGDVMNPATLDGRVVWDHNGSEMLIDAEKGVIVYNAPKSSIRKAVQVGQVLFRGKIDPDGPVSGTAYVFKPGCKPAPYEVKGRWSGDGVLTLTGAAPKRSKTGCGLDGYTTSGGNAKLSFTFLYSP